MRGPRLLLLLAALGLCGMQGFAEGSSGSSAQESTAERSSTAPGAVKADSNAGPGDKRDSSPVAFPKLLSQVDPQYSEEARRAKKGGVVLVGLVVDQDGSPQQVHVIRGVGYGLDEKAIEAVSQYRFKPAIKNGVPIAVKLNIQVNFQIYTNPADIPSGAKKP